MDQATRRFDIRVTDEQFRTLFDTYPHDEVFITEACRQALYDIHVPNRRGLWTKYDARVYIDEFGFNCSGYTLVDGDDWKKVPGCMENGYTPNEHPKAEDIVWDEQPDRERLLGVWRTLGSWAWR